MTGFSAQWLALREPADHRARDRALQNKVCEQLANVARTEQRAVRLIDLGCGSGSNLRALATSLPEQQHWTLVDYDPLLLAAARAALIAWADQVISDQTILSLRKSGKTIDVEFAQVDLARDIERVLAWPADVITAAAFFDLVAETWLVRFCQALRTTLYTVLTYDGSEQWLPAHHADDAMLKAFHAHQKTDKGFGVAAGPDASAIMKRELAARGFQVTLAPSPWQIDQAEAAFIQALATGSAAAVRETGLLNAQDLDQWLAARVTAQHCTVGHWDILATPAR
ncbi:MAG: methyltransferase domain-containing protein [Burkholderiaceae bacterium]|nr:methyltransferase domain-containing protein [Burkholderiaceae bacterium]